MNWLFFIVFLGLALFFIWNGKGRFSKKEWVRMALLLGLILLGTFIIGYIFKWLSLSLSLFSIATAKQYTAIVSLSFLCVWILKLAVVLLCTIFARIMGFHEVHNAENYQKISSISNKFGPGLLIAAKCLVSFGAFLMFYGIWLTAAV